MCCDPGQLNVASQTSIITAIWQTGPVHNLNGVLVHQVVVLRAFRSKLCEALAEVHSTTSALHLHVTKHEDGEGHAGQSSSAGEGTHTEHLFQQARQAIVQTCNSCSKVSPRVTKQDTACFMAV